MPLPIVVPVIAGAKILGGVAARAIGGAAVRGVAGAVARGATGTVARSAAGQAAKTAGTGAARVGTGAVSKAANVASTASMLPMGGKADDAWIEAAKKASQGWRGWSR